MKRISLKLAVAILTFIIGFTAAGLWFIYPLSLSQVLEDLPSDAVITEEAEEYAVYSAAINQFLVRYKGSVSLLAISNHTSSFDDNFHKAIYGNDYIKNTTSGQRVKQMKEAYPSVSDETLFDYDEKKMQSDKLQRNFSLSANYILFNEDEYPEYEASYRIRLSRVGLNKERNQAFVFVQYFNWRLGEGGFSDYLLLEKVDGTWKIKEVFMGIRS